MAFSAKQSRALRAKLGRQNVKTRLSNGASISYLEGWHVIAEANRIFGFENWDRRTLLPRCLWAHAKDGVTACFYSTRVRVAVRAGDTIVVREGIGTGGGRADLPEIALKAAETDATKRALATFGNPFGLALYDKEQSGVTKPKSDAGMASRIMFPLTSDDGKVREFVNAEQLYDAAVASIAAMNKVPSIYAFWEKNRRLLNRLSAVPETSFVASDIILSLKRRLQALARSASGEGHTVAASAVVKDDLESNAARNEAVGTREAAVTIPKEKRLRDKAHLGYVRSKPCIVCGRAPAHAHHIRFAQPRAMGMKVSDEFTVPVCAIHHDELHRTGDERAWWARHGIIEPLKVAAKLWAQSRGFVEQEIVEQDLAKNSINDQSRPAAE